jgi:hypothetical protein
MNITVPTTKKMSLWHPRNILRVSRHPLDGQVVIDTTPQEDLSAFDPANFIASAATIVASLPAPKVDYISLRKPQPTEYVRVTADKRYRMSPVYLLNGEGNSPARKICSVGYSKKEKRFTDYPGKVEANTIVRCLTKQGEWMEKALEAGIQYLADWAEIVA